MNAVRIVATFAALAGLFLASDACDRSAQAQAAGGANGQYVEILDNPDALLENMPSSQLTLNGVKLGDDISAIPATIIKFKRDDHLDCVNASYTIVNNHVWSMSLIDRAKIGQLNVPQIDPELIQMRLGKADEIDQRESDNRRVWKGYWFTSKRSATFSADDSYTGWVSVTVCR
jgi:hypothetical protein